MASRFPRCTSLGCRSNAVAPKFHDEHGAYGYRVLNVIRARGLNAPCPHDHDHYAERIRRDPSRAKSISTKQRQVTPRKVFVGFNSR